MERTTTPAKQTFSTAIEQAVEVRASEAGAMRRDISTANTDEARKSVAVARKRFKSDGPNCPPPAPRKGKQYAWSYETKSWCESTEKRTGTSSVVVFKEKVCWMEDGKVKYANEKLGIMSSEEQEAVIELYLKKSGQ